MIQTALHVERREDAMVDRNQLRGEIETALKAVVLPLAAEIRARPWTHAIKSALAEIGRKHQFEVCCSGLAGGSDWGEWLYDMCWLERGDDPERSWLYKRMPFAMEYEWSPNPENNVLPDFQKLVFSNADLRLLIWQNGTVDSIRKDVRLFEDQIRIAGSDRNKYLFAGLVTEDRLFRFS
jgi:hypothetical protein